MRRAGKNQTYCQKQQLHVRISALDNSQRRNRQQTAENALDAQRRETRLITRTKCTTTLPLGWASEPNYVISTIINCIIEHAYAYICLRGLEAELGCTAHDIVTETVNDKMTLSPILLSCYTGFGKKYSLKLFAVFSSRLLNLLSFVVFFFCYVLPCVKEVKEVMRSVVFVCS